MAVPTIQITGSVIGPDGAPLRDGATITAELSQPGSALDGAVSVRVVGKISGTITAGAVPADFDLVPNDAITPAGTHYRVLISGTTADGQVYRPALPEKWQLASSPASVDIGAVTRIEGSPPAPSYPGLPVFPLTQANGGSGAATLGAGSVTPTGGVAASLADHLAALAGAAVDIQSALASIVHPAGYAAGDDEFWIVAPSVEAPSFDPAAGSYVGSQSVAMASATGSATIYYTTDGSTPTAASDVYASPVTVNASMTLKAIATKSGYTDSAVASSVYAIESPEPAFVDAFSDSALNSTYWEASTANSGAVVETTSLACDATALATSAAIVALKQALAPVTQSYSFDFDTAQVANGKTPIIAQGSSKAALPAAGDSSTTFWCYWLINGTAGLPAFTFNYRDAAGSNVTPLNIAALGYNGAMRFVLYTTATQWRWRVLRVDTLAELWAGSWVAWSATFNNGANPKWLSIGRINNTSVAARQMVYTYTRFERT